MANLIPPHGGMLLPRLADDAARDEGLSEARTAPQVRLSPREAILHAIIRQNFGCSHLIIGRDHVGVGSYYAPFDAQKIFDDLSPEDLYIPPLKLDATFWCRKYGSMASAKTCPHADEDHLLISETKLRETLTKGERPPEQFSRREVVDILAKYCQSKAGNSR